uniref:Conjugal protein, TraA n=1 Tax=Leptospirillum sp. Group II '5-way CG' TaxID=419541 RepID=B6ANK5_9BACT|nr:MAG: Conjugal protein, TraA [Leptospirillum sp. Group II '5-way CG']
MLSITVKKGQTAKGLAGVADYPDENRNKEKQVGAVEDYYSQGSEATPSRWLGGAAAELGLSGAVNREDLLATLQGFDPRTGEALVQKAGVDRRYAFDLTFSAPKSVSIAWAVGTEDVKRGIEAAQDRAVERTLTFIEEKFALARRGSSKEGTITKEHVKLLAAVYCHGSSRELDPQIHSHAMLQNMGLRADGTWGALNEKELFEWKLALGAVYRAELSLEISKNLGFGIEADREYFRLAGIPKELEEEFSKRRVQIEKALSEKGLSGAKASEVAALNTRKGKEVVEAEILSEEWTKIAGEYGITAESLQGLRSMERESKHDSFSLDHPELFRKLTTMEAVFQEKDLVRIAGGAYSQNGRGLDAVKTEVAACLKDPEIVKLRGKDGAIYYTTQKMLVLEKEIQAMARAGKEDARHVVSPEATKAGIARYEFEKGFRLSDEQHNAINHLTTRAGRIQILEGHAGAGKSTALVPVRYALESQGFEVVGCSLQGKKAAGLQKDTGIRSQTIASLLRELQGFEREDGGKVPPTKTLTEKTVVVVDEAAMNDTRLMAGLIRETEKAGVRLILVGDESQVPPVAAGNPFKTLKKELGCAELTENRRQRSDWQKDASREIRSGQVKEGLQKYLEANMISIAQDREEAIKKTVKAWCDRFVTSDPTKTLLTAYKRSDVSELNARARETMQEKGLLSGPRVETTVRDREGNSEGKREFQAGERLYFKKNNRKLGVMNGDTGTLAHIDVTSNGKDCMFTVRMDNGKEICFDPRDYEQIDYGYAVTIHKSQGETVDFSSNLVTGMGLNALYVQLTRHRDGTQIVLTEDQIDKMAQNSGVELEPTDKMIDFTEQLLAKQPKLAPLLPEDWNKKFDVLREFLDKHSGVELGGRKERDGQNEFDPRLEKVKALLASIRKNEKMNPLDFEVVDEKEKKEGKLEKWIGKEVLEKPEDRSMGAPSPEKEPGNGKEEGIRPAEREYELERGGMEM